MEVAVFKRYNPSVVVPVLSHAKPFPSGRLQTRTGTHAPFNAEPVPYQKPLCTKHSQVSLPSADTRTVVCGYTLKLMDTFNLTETTGHSVHTGIQSYTQTHTHRHSHSGVQLPQSPEAQCLPHPYTSYKKPRQQLRTQDI